MSQLTYANLVGVVALAFGAVLAASGIFSLVMVVDDLIEPQSHIAFIVLLIFGPAAIIGLGIGALLIWLGYKRIRKPPEAV